MMQFISRQVYEKCMYTLKHKFYSQNHNTKQLHSYLMQKLTQEVDSESLF